MLLSSLLLLLAAVDVGAAVAAVAVVVVVVVVAVRSWGPGGNHSLSAGSSTKVRKGETIAREESDNEDEGDR